MELQMVKRSELMWNTSSKNSCSITYRVVVGKSSQGIDLPSKNILTDIKVTSVRQPQSSCPYRDAKRKIVD